MLARPPPPPPPPPLPLPPPSPPPPLPSPRIYFLSFCCCCCFWKLIFHPEYLAVPSSPLFPLSPPPPPPTPLHPRSNFCCHKLKRDVNKYGSRFRRKKGRKNIFFLLTFRLFGGNFFSPAVSVRSPLKKKLLPAALPPPPPLRQQGDKTTHDSPLPVFLFSLTFFCFWSGSAHFSLSLSLSSESSANTNTDSPFFLFIYLWEEEEGLSNFTLLPFSRPFPNAVRPVKSQFFAPCCWRALPNQQRTLSKLPPVL